MKKYCLLLFLLCSVISSSFADNTSVLLEGTIGKARIVLQLTIGDQVHASYYYKRFKQSLDLGGRWLDDNILELKLESWDTVKETFLLQDIGTAGFHYTGTWTSADGTSLPVSLTELDLKRVVVKNPWVTQMKLSGFDFARLADIDIKKDSVQKLSEEISITWYHDSLTKFSSFHVNPVAALKGIDSVNRWQEQLHMSEVLSYLDCGESGQSDAEYTSGIGDVYVRGHVLSIYLVSSYYCGGAHPDFSTDGFTINLETGKFLSVTDFIYFQVPAVRQDTYMSDVFAPNVVIILTRLYPQKMKPGGDSETECDYSSSDVWDYCSWYLTKDGLRLCAYFYRAARNCDGDPFSVIPYSELQKYKNPSAQIPMPY